MPSIESEPKQMKKASDIPLVRGGKLPQGALRWFEEAERVFPGATKDIVIVRNPNSSFRAGRNR
jgi:hypothetical protein